MTGPHKPPCPECDGLGCEDGAGRICVREVSEAERLRAALHFYAAERSWQPLPYARGRAVGGYYYATAVVIDGGAKARAALSAVSRTEGSGG
jgi:hypothetical protein